MKNQYVESIFVRLLCWPKMVLFGNTFYYQVGPGDYREETRPASQNWFARILALLLYPFFQPIATLIRYVSSKSKARLEVIESISSQKERARDIIEKREKREEHDESYDNFQVFKNALSVEHEEECARAVDGAKPISNASLNALCRASRGLNSLFAPVLNDRTSAALKRVVCFGDEYAANVILSCQPAFLLEKMTFKEPCGRDLTGTIFQWALKCHDYRMCEMMISRFKAIPNHVDIIRKQINEVFPCGVSECLKMQTSYNFDWIADLIEKSNMNDVYNALNCEDDESELCKGLKRFREEFSELAKKEDVFNPQHILRLLHIYATLETRFLRPRPRGVDSSLGSGRRDLFWVQVYGYVCRFAPGYFKQAFCNGLCQTKGNTPFMYFKRNNMILLVVGSMDNAAEANIHELSIGEAQFGFDYSVFPSSYYHQKRPFCSNSTSWSADAEMSHHVVPVCFSVFISSNGDNLERITKPSYYDDRRAFPSI